MKLTLPNKLTRLDAHWEMLAITAVLFVLVAVFVDLKPVVEEIFSFPRAIPDSGNPRRSSNVSRRSRKLSWRWRPAIFLHRVTWVEFKNSRSRSTRSTRRARSRARLNDRRGFRTRSRARI